VTSPASVSGDERLRLFLALRLPDDVLDEVERWQHEHLRDVRAVPREHLHVTLAFLGHRPARELEPIVGALRAAAPGAREIRLEPVRYRETRSVGMLTCADEDGRATRLAESLAEHLEAIGLYRRERRPWLPHVTVLRFRERPRLQPPMPELDSFAPSDAAAFLSRLHPSGAVYEVLESFPLNRRRSGG
jgi:RNA 2',3'-cyclic 3'-phosphodiesterase